MESHEFTLHIQHFHEEFNIDDSPEGRAKKLLEEHTEFRQALEYGTKEQQDDEAVDVLVCSWSNCIARGIHNPFFAGYLKLELTRRKYREAKL